LRSALARLEPPPKSFIIIIDGALIANPSGDNSTLELAQLPHLDSLAREGCNGLLAATVGQNNPSLTCQILQGSAADASPLPERFKNIQVALVGNSNELEATGESVRCHSTRVFPLNAPQKWPQTESLAKELTSSLGKHLYERRSKNTTAICFFESYDVTRMIFLPCRCTAIRRICSFLLA
jgi:hypothetical protein